LPITRSNIPISHIFSQEKNEKKTIVCQGLLVIVFSTLMPMKKTSRILETLEHGKSKRLISADPALGEVFSDVRDIFAKTDLPAIIQGETGTGKEGIARALHWHGDRKDKPFVAVNCGGIPESLIESEFFGHEKGAFSGATSRRRGHFEEANGGTLFLDEIAELPMGLQARLLRVLQEGEIVRVGSSKPVSVDVRIVAATNKDLKQLVDQNKFRADLYYRLATHIAAIPALQNRPGDVEVLTTLFINEGNERFGGKVSGIQLVAKRMLKAYSWPGNVRELQSLILSAVARLAATNFSIKIGPSHLPRNFRQALEADKSIRAYQPELLRNRILEYLSQNSPCSISKLAAALDSDYFSARRQAIKLAEKKLLTIAPPKGRHGRLLSLK